MGCFGRLFKWRRKGSTHLDSSHSDQAHYGPRPAHDSLTSGNSDFAEIEKAYIRDRDGRDRDGRPVAPLPPNAAKFRPNVNPQFSAYAGVAVRDDAHIYSPRQRGGGGSAYSHSHDWTGSQVSTQVSSRQSDQYLSKIKDEGLVHDPEQEARNKKAAEIRRKAEQEEQERLDFFQML